MNNIQKALQEHLEIMSQVENLIPLMEKAATKMNEAIAKGGKILWMGNGGSAADAQHLAAELLGRFQRERKAIAAIALTTDTSVLTSLANDYDYSVIFSRQVEALCRPNDIVIALSTSGNSRNVIEAIHMAKKLGGYTISLTGQSGEIQNLVDLSICVPSSRTARIQEAHIFIGHMICELVEENTFQMDIQKEELAL